LRAVSRQSIANEREGRWSIVISQGSVAFLYR
jgi:hypothetical protein